MQIWCSLWTSWIYFLLVNVNKDLRMTDLELIRKLLLFIIIYLSSAHVLSSFILTNVERQLYFSFFISCMKSDLSCWKLKYFAWQLSNFVVCYRKKLLIVTNCFVESFGQGYPEVSVHLFFCFPCIHKFIWSASFLSHWKS